MDKSFYSLTYVKLTDVAPYARNAREHSREQVTQIVNSIREFGFTSPILIDAGNVLIAGHGRLAAAREMGMAELPAIVIEGLSETQKQALRLADNKLALNASWDDDLLRAELMDLRDVGFDLGLTGFGEPELAGLFADMNDGLTDPDEVPEPPAEPVTRTGDVWLLGRHRLVCGDCMDVLPTLTGIDAFILDPPYSSGGQFRGDRSAAPSKKYVQTESVATHRGDFSGDNRDQRAFLAWSSMWFGQMLNCSKPGAVVCTFTDWRQLPTMSDAVQAGGWVWRNIVTWWKPGIRMQRGRFSSSSEYLIYASNGVPAEGVDSPQNVLSYAPVVGKDKEHIAEKPVGLLCDLLGVTPFQATVADPFSGSGTTIIAAEMTGRACHAIEISPQYCDVTIQRWQNFTGQTATRPDGQAFDTERRATISAD